MREHIEKNVLFSKYQRAYRKFFATDLARVKVTNDLLLNLDKTKSTVTLSIMKYLFRFLKQIRFSKIKCLAF